MKNLPFIFLILISLNALSQNRQPKELGIGLIIASNPETFEDLSTPDNLYKDKEMTKKWESDKVFPFFFKPDYGLYHFICLEKTTVYYKILVNHVEEVYVPNDSSYYFKTWDAILLQSTVERLTKDNPIKKDCHNESEIISNPCEIDRFTVQDILQKEGEYWLFIYFSPKCEDYPDKNSDLKYGWIKWRTEDELLVNILLLC